MITDYSYAQDYNHDLWSESFGQDNKIDFYTNHGTFGVNRFSHEAFVAKEFEKTTPGILLLAFLYLHSYSYISTSISE